MNGFCMNLLTGACGLDHQRSLVEGNEEPKARPRLVLRLRVSQQSERDPVGSRHQHDQLGRDHHPPQHGRRSVRRPEKGSVRSPFPRHPQVHLLLRLRLLQEDDLPERHCLSSLRAAMPPDVFQRGSPVVRS